MSDNDITHGIVKLNISTDISKTQVRDMQEGIAAEVNNSFDLSSYEFRSIEKIVEEKMRLFLQREPLLSS